MLRYLASIAIILEILTTAVYSQRYFEFGNHFYPQGNDFVAATSDSIQIALATSQILLPDTLRDLHISGSVAHGNPGYNLQWHWHFRPDQWQLVQTSVEVCDVKPSVIEQDTSSWTDGWLFCPFSSYVLREIYPTLVKQEVVNEQSVEIYPNPTRGVFSVGVPAVGINNYVLEVFNVLGQKMLAQTIPGARSSTQSQIDISELPNGTYYLRILFGKKEVVGKIVKQ